MQDDYAKNINKLEKGSLTKYLIGRNTDLDADCYTLLTDKVANY